MQRVSWLVALAGFCVAASPVAADDGADVAAVHEVRGNLFLSNAQDHAALAVDPRTGCSLAVWGSRRQENGGYGVFGRLLDPAGKPVGGEIHINQYTINNQQDPAVAFAPDGSAWVVWQSFLQDGDQGGIVMRRFGWRDDGVFAALSDEMIVNHAARGDQTTPSVAVSDDRVLVMWESREVLDGESGERAAHVAKARLFDGAGTPLGDEFRMMERDAALPSAAALPNGGFVAVCAERTVRGAPRGIVMVHIDRSGTPLGEPRSVPMENERWNVEPAIASDADGNFVVAWMGQSDSRGWNVCARSFDVHGNAVSGDIEVARCGPDAWKSGVDVAMTDRGFAVAYNNEADGPVQLNVKNPQTPADVFCQHFDRFGNPLGSARRVNVESGARRVLSIASNHKRLAWNSARGELLVASEGTIQDDGSGIAVTTIGSSNRTGGSSTPGFRASVDPVILAENTLADARLIARFPPDYDPFFVPEPPDINPFNPGADFGFQAFQATGWTPPDPDLAVGPNHIVVAVNGGIRFFDKDGNLTFADDISGPEGFWGEVGANSFVFDPVCVFDVHSQRYIVATTEHADNGNDLINLAVSDDSDPNGAWHKYRFNLSSVGDFIDFPNLGVGPDAIYICTDYFDPPTGNHIHIFDKADVLNGAPTTPNVVRTSNGFRSLGSVNHLTSDAPAQYFATAFDGNSTQIGLDAIRNPNGTPIRNTFLLTVPSFGQPPDAEQQGTTNRASTVDMRIKNGVYRDGFLWLAHTIGQNNTARVRWYQIAMNGWPASGQNPALVDTGTQDLGPGVHNWFPDISVDAQGRVGVAFNRSSLSEFISVQRTFRLPTDSPGTLREPQLMQVSTSPEQGSRWGDYGGIEHDPANPGVFWNHHEYRTTNWRTWVGRFDVEDGLEPLGFLYPNGLPATIDSDGGTSFLVEVVDQTGIAEPGTGTLYVNDGGGFQQYPMTDLGGDLYDAVFPSVACGIDIEFYVSAETSDGIVVTDPPNAPASSFTAPSYADITVIFADDFETNQGWTVENVDLSDGAWQRGVPAGDGTRGDPTTDFDGSGQCYLTANRAGNADIDGGPTRLISPRFDLSGRNDATISYARWFFNDDGDIDRLSVEISNNDGVNWTLVESVADTNTGGWNVFQFNPSDYLSLTNQMRMRFSASDNPNDSVTEAAIDAFDIFVRSCESGGDETVLTDALVTVGTLLDGNVDALRASDNVYFRTRSGFGATLIDLHNMTMQVIAATTVQSPATMDLRFETRIDQPSGTAQVRLFNWNTLNFQLVGQFAIGSGGDQVNTINGINAANFIEPGGGIIVEAKHLVFVPFLAFTFESFVDEVRIDVQ